jgi:hypothetical protein
MRLRKYPKPGRNHKCLCGSGKKFKKCCTKQVDEIIDGVNRKFAENLSAKLLDAGKIRINPDNGEVEYVE